MCSPAAGRIIRFGEINCCHFYKIIMDQSFKIAQWDLALERDAETEQDDPAMKDLPPQLLFIHQGLKDVKEIHWHRKVSGLLMATSQTGLDVFRTISV